MPLGLWALAARCCSPRPTRKDITDASLAVMMLMAWDQDVDFDDLLG